jgi:hypothetical protein
MQVKMVNMIVARQNFLNIGPVERDEYIAVLHILLMCVGFNLTH